MKHTVQFLDVNNPREIERAFTVFTYLRPHLTAAKFCEQVPVQYAEGYRMIFVELDGVFAAAAGYRVLNFLAWGKVLYIDDLITHPEKKRNGLGGALLDWLIEEARRLKCDEVHLDTGYGRHDAHRLYLNKGFKLATHHMSIQLASLAVRKA